MLPGSLARAAHHQQIAVRLRQPQRRAATAGPQRECAGGAEADDRDHGVLCAAAADGVTVPRDAVGPVAIPAQADGGERLPELAGVDVVEPPPNPGQLRMW